MTGLSPLLSEPGVYTPILFWSVLNLLLPISFHHRSLPFSSKPNFYYSISFSRGFNTPYRRKRTRISLHLSHTLYLLYIQDPVPSLSHGHNTNLSTPNMCLRTGCLLPILGEWVHWRRWVPPWKRIKHVSTTSPVVSGIS